MLLDLHPQIVKTWTEATRSARQLPGTAYQRVSPDSRRGSGPDYESKERVVQLQLEFARSGMQAAELESQDALNFIGEGMSDANAIWRSFGAALGGEARDHLSIEGASGLTHSVEGISVDETRNRLIVFSAEPSPRIAAMMQVDISATMPGTQVLVARPIMFDIPSIFRKISGQLGTTEVDLTALTKGMQGQGDLAHIFELDENKVPKILPDLLSAFSHVKLPPFNQILAGLQQLSYVDWSRVRPSETTAHVDLVNLLKLDNVAVDIQHGVCPIPLYDLTEREWEDILSGRDIDVIASCLKRLGVYQYFYPAPDQVALGAVDRGMSHTIAGVATAVSTGPKIGHPLGEMEIVSPRTSLPEVVSELIDMGLLVEGEMSLELTESGREARGTIKFAPREGFLSKLSRILSVKAQVDVKANVDTSSLLGPGTGG